MHQSGNDEVTAEELACLHRQVTMRQACMHGGSHESVADAIVRRYFASSPAEIQRRARAACSPRR